MIEIPGVAVELLVAGLVLALMARRAWVIPHREDEPISEAQTRANAAPLTTAILPPDRRKREHF